MMRELEDSQRGESEGLADSTISSVIHRRGLPVEEVDGMQILSGKFLLLQQPTGDIVHHDNLSMCQEGVLRWDGEKEAYFIDATHPFIYRYGYDRAPCPFKYDSRWAAVLRDE